MDKKLIELTNPEFAITFRGNEYLVRKANLRQQIAYQEKLEGVKGKVAAEHQAVAYAFYLILRDKIEGLTEADVQDNLPADIDILESLTSLGFISPDKAEMVRRLQAETVEKLIGSKSSASLPKRQDGLQTKSENSPSTNSSST